MPPTTLGVDLDLEAYVVPERRARWPRRGVPAGRRPGARRRGPRRSRAGGAPRPGGQRVDARGWSCGRAEPARRSRPAARSSGWPCRPAGSRTRSRLLSMGRTGSDSADPRARGALDDPREAEQLVLDLVEAAGASGLLERRLGAEDLDAVDQVRADDQREPATACSTAKDRALTRDSNRVPSSASAGRLVGAGVGEGAGEPGLLARAAGRRRAGRRDVAVTVASSADASSASSRSLASASASRLAPRT